MAHVQVQFLMSFTSLGVTAGEGYCEVSALEKIGSLLKSCVESKDKNFVVSWW